MRNELLAIDDTDLHRLMLRKIAGQASFATTGAASVSAAARLLRERVFDCITLDLSLGEQSGVEILQLLAAMNCRTPVIVISGSGQDTCAETVKLGHSLDLNLCPPVPKPIHVAGLREMLKQIAADASVRKPATPSLG